jgi:hypothetical protein
MRGRLWISWNSGCQFPDSYSKLLDKFDSTCVIGKRRRGEINRQHVAN